MVDFEMSAHLSQPFQPSYRFAEDRPASRMTDDELFAAPRARFDLAGGAEFDDDLDS